MPKGNSRAAGPVIALALATFGLLGCGSGGGGSTSTGPALSSATAGQLAKLSDRVASDLDAGDTCSAARAADELASAVQQARLPKGIRAGVTETASRLVDQVNCPPPPPPAPVEKKPKPDKHGDQHHGDQGHVPPGHAKHGGFGPPGQAKLKGEPE